LFLSKSAMLKQFTSIVFLLLANIIMLAHDVIPHHHHDDNICFENHSCTANHSHESEAPNQPSKDKETCCLLAGTLIFTPASSVEINCPCCESSHNREFFDYSFIAYGSVVGLNFWAQLPFRQNPHKSNNYHFLADQTYGLRAPPLA
jgi:hypothetical protein